MSKTSPPHPDVVVSVIHPAHLFVRLHRVVRWIMRQTGAVGLLTLKTLVNNRNGPKEAHSFSKVHA